MLRLSFCVGCYSQRFRGSLLVMVTTPMLIDVNRCFDSVYIVFPPHVRDSSHIFKCVRTYSDLILSYSRIRVKR